MKSKISDPTCVYHACVSNDCQKKIFIKNAGSNGQGKCEKPKPVQMELKFDN